MANRKFTRCYNSKHFEQTIIREKYILAVSVSEPSRENSKLFSFMALKEILNIGNI